MKHSGYKKLAGAAASLAVLAAGITMSSAQMGAVAAGSSHPPRLPITSIERVLEADGHVSHGVLAVEEDRSDVHAVGGHTRSPFKEGFQLQHEMFFQSLGAHRAIVNGDFSLKPGEIQPVIDTLLARGLQVQAEHQHLYDIRPMMWFVHFRGVGRPVALAHKVEAAIRRTSTPQPQSSPKHPKTRLPGKRLARILGGDATIGENGIVTVDVDRTDKITLGGVRINPGLNVATNVQFEPVRGGTVVVADFAMTAPEINPVLHTMRRARWESGCLYNQETAEHPQLYFDHFFKKGHAIALARQIRRGLDKTDSER